MGQEDQLQLTVSRFGALLGTVTEMMRSKASRADLLDAYDDASDDIIAELRGAGIGDEQVQTLHKALARLRLAFEERK